ncbi:hypothetical protein TTHERM_00241730 (macronuclear) [Tetrahymena thermophila SB210]|uniref:Uncharacterized protein n=1 Tax=Tetrahymena thermophila (strain SB210) TaxID=312017 RepID=I7MMD6_TETTS|nr:hypothetical protein TTHERM_00241730 [Tetrahymena thermophila SB210]EAS04652.2 hypothetical protein TTHERM_00241730 [Tetrahymena thermophila SB210]|eukprot:XP_001024897.2 hypothetical protein TTHERM_00241730 [Tetrahymena thermophila SB210]
MLKNSSKRKSIYKEFPIQQIYNTNVNSGNKSNNKQMSLSSTNQSSSHGGSTSTSSQQHLDQQQVQSNQKLSIFARLIPEDLIAQKQEYKEGIRQEKCIFKLNKHEIQIIQPDEKRILEEIDAFQKRERIQHSPPKFYIGQQKEEINQRSISPIGQQQNANYVNKTVRNEGNAVAQEDLDLNQRRNNFQEITPEKDRNKHIKPFQSPISKISYFENSNNDSRPNTFTFDQIFDESVNDEEFFNSIKQMYLSCIRSSKNLIILNLNRSLINSQTFFKEFINGLINLSKLQGFQYISSEKSQFFLQSYEILHPPNEKYLLLDLQPINQQNPDDIIKEMRLKQSQIPRKQTQSCTVFNFQLFDDNKLINEIVIIDMQSFLDKKQSQNSNQNQNSYQQNYNSYCKDLINLLNLQQTGKVNSSDPFLQILLQKFKLSDELIILANFKVIQPYITTNYYLLLLSQILYKQKIYFNSIFVNFCQIQNQYIHHFLGRDLTYDTQQLSMKEENQILSQKNHMIKEQVRIITADLIHHQEQLSKLQKENSMYLSDIRDLKRIIVDQDNQLMAYKKKISDQTSKIDGMKKNFGILDNFDKSMVIDSKNKSFNKILSNIYSSKKSFHEIETQDQETQTDFISNNLERDVSNNLKKSLQDERISQQNKNIQNYYQNQQEQNFCKNCKQNLDVNQTDSNINNQMNYKSFNALQDIASSDFENYPFLFNEDDKNDIITPNRFLQNLDDILLNLDSKRSTYFSPRNLSLANLALIENEGYKQKLLIKDQEIEKLQFKLKEINSSLQQKDSQFKFKDQERLVHLKQIEKLITLFEKKLIGCDQIIADIVEYYENELLEFKKIIQFGFQAYTNEIKELQKDIHVINQEKQKWGQVFAKKTEEIYKQMSSKIQQKNEKIKQYEEVLQKFGQIGSYK